MSKIDTAGTQQFKPISGSKRDSFKLSLKVVVFAVIAAFVISDILYLFMNKGHASLKENAMTAEPVLQQTEAVSAEEAVIWKDGWVKYNGGIYEYKDGTMNFLLMGIDKNLDGTAVSGGLEGGQADFLALLVLDAEDESIRLIPINRNTMSTVEMFDEKGEEMFKTTAQIAVQHGVGDGQEESCEYQVRAVSNLFYQLLIHGYAALSLEGIVPLNDEIGGIDVVAPMDYVSSELNVREGEELHLQGDDAYWFLRSRDQELGGADRRFSRQRVYLEALVSGLYSRIKEDPLSLITMYNSISNYVVTDIDSSELAYLATQASRYSYDNSHISDIAGETVEGEISDEFYVDDESLRKLIIDTFYKKVR